MKEKKANIPLLSVTTRCLHCKNKVKIDVTKVHNESGNDWLYQCPFCRETYSLLDDKDFYKMAKFVVDHIEEIKDLIKRGLVEMTLDFLDKDSLDISKEAASFLKSIPRDELRAKLSEFLKCNSTPN